MYGVYCRIIWNEKRKKCNYILDANTLFANRKIIEGGSLGVLNMYKGIAVLVEAGFISNSSDLNILKTKSKEVGIDIANGIINYLNK